MKSLFLLTFICILIAALELGVQVVQVQATIMDADPIGPDVFECGRAAAVQRECLAYASGMASEPLPSCCSGFKMIVQMVSKPEDKLLGCRCFKEVTSYFKTIKETAISDLSKACRIDFAMISGEVCNS